MEIEFKKTNEGITFKYYKDERLQKIMTIEECQNIHNKHKVEITNTQSDHATWSYETWSNVEIIEKVVYYLPLIKNRTQKKKLQKLINTLPIKVTYDTGDLSTIEIMPFEKWYDRFKNLELFRNMCYGDVCKQILRIEGKVYE